MLLVLIRRLGSEKLTLAVTANNLDREAPRQVRVERDWPFRGERRRLRQRLDSVARAAVPPSMLPLGGLVIPTVRHGNRKEGPTQREPAPTLS